MSSSSSSSKRLKRQQKHQTNDKLHISTIGDRKCQPHNDNDAYMGGYYNNDRLYDDDDEDEPEQPRMQQPSSESIMLEMTNKTLQRMQKDSIFFAQNTISQLPQFSQAEVRLGKRLGAGEFGVVHEVVCLTDSPDCNCEPGTKGEKRKNFVNVKAKEETNIEEKKYCCNGNNYDCNKNNNDIQSSNKTSCNNNKNDTSKKNICGNDPFACSSKKEPTSCCGNGTKANNSNETGPKKSCCGPTNNEKTNDDNKYSTGCCGPKLEPKIEVNDPKQTSTAVLDDAVDTRHDSTEQKQNIEIYDHKKNNNAKPSSQEEIIHNLKTFMTNNLNRCGTLRYAVKRLKADIGEKMKIDAAIDLACEARFLATLHHGNIVHMRGTVGVPGHVDFGIILDKLQCTMREKMEEWEESLHALRQMQNCCMIHIVGHKSPQQEKAFTDHLVERLLAVYDIARAMKYLHKNRILFRDLKPENCGLNFRGDLRLFDFGLSKELKQKDLVEPPDGYEATGLTGSRRYMAPEVVLCKNYGFSADVYSFAILFYEVISLKQAYPKLTFDTHFQKIVLKAKRPNPKLAKGLSSQLITLMKECWSHDRMNRPKFKAICEQFRMGISDLSNDESVLDRSQCLMDKSDRSFTREECC